jgi:16S rRNA processing protein RimM
VDVEHYGQDLLVLRRPDGGEALVPFVTAIVPTVDLPAGRVVLDPPPGLLE